MLAEPNIDSLKEEVIKILTLDKLAHDLSERAYLHAQSTNWNAEAVKFSHILDSIK